MDVSHSETITAIDTMIKRRRIRKGVLLRNIGSYFRLLMRYWVATPTLEQKAAGILASLQFVYDLETCFTVSKSLATTP